MEFLQYPLQKTTDQNFKGQQLFSSSTALHFHEENFLPAAFSVIMPIERGTTTTPISRLTPIISAAPARRELTRSPPVFTRAPAPEPTSLLSDNYVGLTVTTSPQTKVRPLIPDTAFLHESQSPNDNVAEIVDAAAWNLKKRLTANTSTVQVSSKSVSWSGREWKPLMY